MEKLMRQMGIKSRQIDSAMVVIETPEGKIKIPNPQVTEIEMHGQKTYQIAGAASFEGVISEEDIRMVMEQAKCTRDEASQALERTKGDIAQAIIFLSEQKK